MPKYHSPTPPAPSLPSMLSMEAILTLLTTGHKPQTLDQLLRSAKVHRRHKKAMEAHLQALAEEGRIVRMSGGQWVAASQMRIVQGRYSVQRSGVGFVDIKPADAFAIAAISTDVAAPNPGGKAGRTDKNKSRAKGKEKERGKARREAFSVFVHPAQAGNAWHGDVVRVALLPGRSTGKSPEGRIVEVLERTNKEIAARVLGKQPAPHARERRLVCKPADSRFPFLLQVGIAALEKIPGENELLLVRPGAQLASDLWAGEALSSFGCEDDVSVQEQLVKLNHQAPADFPQLVLDAAQALPPSPRPEDWAGREDVRSLPFVTIDGADARDFDDAVYVEALPKGGWRLCVGIADVTHYVRPRLPLDDEARLRGNSWYFPRSVEPMLPAALSNGLCSLNPHVDRLIMLADMHLDAQGCVLGARFATAIMRSAARLTYEAVHQAVTVKNQEQRELILAQERGAEILTMLEHAENLAHALAKMRKQRGSLDFNLPEAEYVFDAQGRITDIKRKEHVFAHQIIEELMIATNEAVARFLEEKGLPFLYRVHPEPDQLRLEGLFRTLASTDLAAHVPNSPDAKALQGILREAQGGPQEFLVGRLALRTMPQARYQPENQGHFGLASACYCHFTSPIRRYADVVVHRALKYALSEDVGPIPTAHKLLMLGDQLNRCERAAMEAEREMARRLATQVLQDRIGESFTGTVAAVTDFGIFVELDCMPVEGMVRLDSLGDDYFEYDAERQELTGVMTGMRFGLGQPVRTKLVSVNLGRLEITLTLLELPQHKGRPFIRKKGAQGRGFGGKKMRR